MRRVIVLIVNTPKYSIEDLPGDTWEVRRTKQVARAILRTKIARGMTTDALAKQCSVYLGEENAVKTSTLNGLFAGKRRTISFTEIEMFSQVLGISMLELLYPVAETVEVRPGVTKTSADALVRSLKAVLDFGQTTLWVQSRDAAVLDVIERAWTVDMHAGKAIYAVQKFGPEHSQSRLNLEKLKYAVFSFKNAVRRLKEHGEQIPSIPKTVEWALEFEGDEVPVDFLLFAIEPLYKDTGTLIGDYRLGGESV